jgi:hypothetical protein
LGEEEHKKDKMVKRETKKFFFFFFFSLSLFLLSVFSRHFPLLPFSPSASLSFSKGEEEEEEEEKKKKKKREERGESKQIGIKSPLQRQYCRWH